MASELFANRTSLAQVMHESGYENYSNYINRVGARLKIPANANQSGRDFKSHSDSVCFIEGVTWSDTLNTILPLKAIIQIKPIERVAYANQSGRD